jgi:hypothetical protein
VGPKGHCVHTKVRKEVGKGGFWRQVEKNRNFRALDGSAMDIGSLRVRFGMDARERGVSVSGADKVDCGNDFGWSA